MRRCFCVGPCRFVCVNNASVHQCVNRSVHNHLIMFRNVTQHFDISMEHTYLHAVDIKKSITFKTFPAPVIQRDLSFRSFPCTSARLGSLLTSRYRNKCTLVIGLTHASQDGPTQEHRVSALLLMIGRAGGNGRNAFAPHVYLTHHLTRQPTTRPPFHPTTHHHHPTFRHSEKQKVSSAQRSPNMHKLELHTPPRSDALKILGAYN